MVVEGYEQVCPLAGPGYRMVEDNLWMVQSGILVLGMNAAFGLLEAGCVRSRNVLNIMMKNVSDMTLGGVGWWIMGYKLSFQVGSDEDWPNYIYDECFWFFQWTFAATAATIDSGAIAERVNYLSYVMLSQVTTMVIYPVAVSWVWASEGYLVEKGFADFAGGAVVHMLGACSALMCCLLVGPRVGRFVDYTPKYQVLLKWFCARSGNADYYIMPAGHGQIAAVTDAVSLVWGVFFLWIGWYGFNPGGVTDIEYGGTYVNGRVFINTTMGALGGGFMNFVLMMYFNRGKAYAEGFALGVLAGLVGITAGCIWSGNGDNFLIGMIAAALAEATRRLLAWAWIDDVVTAIPVHGVPGAFGTLCIAFFSQAWSCNPDGPIGLFYSKPGEETDAAWELLGVQIEGCLLIAFWASGATAVTIIVINMIPHFALRLERAVELKGLDQCEHDMTHDNDDMEDIVKHFFASVSKNSKEDYRVQVQNAATEALQCLSFAHHMEEFAHNRANRKCDLTLIVKDMTVSGLNPNELQAGCMTACVGRTMTVIVEVVSAIRLEDCFQRDFNYFAPRLVQMSGVDASKKEVAFAGELIFEDFYVPPGSEESTYVCLTLVLGGQVNGQAHFPFLNADWQPMKDSSVAGIQAASHAEVVFLKEAVQKAHPEGVQGHIRLECPVRSPTRRLSQQKDITETDKAAKGALHHSEKLSSFELARRQLQKEGDANQVRMTMMDRISPGESKDNKGAAPPQAQDAGSDKRLKIAALMAEAKQLREEWTKVKALPSGATAAAEPWDVNA